MNVSSAANVARTQATMASKEAAETRGAPDHDSDADDVGAAAAPAKAAPAPGTGTKVDKTA